MPNPKTQQDWFQVADAWRPPSRKKGPPRAADLVLDPIIFKDMCWPHIQFYAKQEEIAQSLAYNNETYVVGGNMLGKDFFTAFYVLYFFLTRHPCRIVTTSVDATQLEGVLWGEMNELIEQSRVQFPLNIKHQHIRKYIDPSKRKLCRKSYILGRVSATGEGMQGHHIAVEGDGIPRTLFVADEASAVADRAYDGADTWARRKLIIGNPLECQNFFRKGVDGGNKPSTIDKEVFDKYVIRIKATDSPNVRLGLIQEHLGIQPTNQLLIPGVKDYFTYLQNLASWDIVKQTVSLNASFYTGADLLLCPPQWLDAAEALADKYLMNDQHQKPTAMSIDAAMGNDDTTWTLGNHFGITHQYEKKTPDTNEIFKFTLHLAHKFHISPNLIVFDSGGGGKQHADRLRASGLNVRIVNFGSAVKAQIQPSGKLKSVSQREREDLEHYEYVNRRAQMYHLIRLNIDPGNGLIWAIPRKFVKLRQQLAPIPLLTDEKGRLWLPPKRPKSTITYEGERKKVTTLYDLLKRSPDHADGAAMLRWVLSNPKRQVRAGAA